MKRVLETAEPLSAAARSLDEMEHIFEAAARRAEHHGRDGAAPRNAAAPRKVAAAREPPPRAPACQGRRGRSRHRARRAAAKQAARRTRAVTALAAGTSAKASTKAATKTASKTTTPTAAKSAAPRKPANNKTKPQ